MNRRVVMLSLGAILLFSCSPLANLVTPFPTEDPEPSFLIVTATSQPAKPTAAGMEPSPVPDSLAPAAVDATEGDSLFTPVFPSGDLPDGKVASLWVDAEGSLWLSGSQGVYRREDAAWITVYTAAADRILGQDDIGRVWVLLEEGAYIAAWRDGEWTVYGKERGWQPVEPGGYLSRGFGDGLVMDDEGRLWLATGGDDVRRLDPGNGLWTSLNARQIGFAAPEELYQGHFLTDVVLSEAGNVWVANCIGMGESLAGQGIQRFNGQAWLGTEFTRADCIFDMEVDQQGVVWAGAVDALLQYSPLSGSWSRIRLPLWGRFQVVLDVTLDEQGRPWVQLLRAGGASLDGGAALFYLDGGEWVPVLEQGADWEPYTLLQAGDGTAWVFVAGELFFYSPDGMQKIGDLPAYAVDMVIDGDGRLWLARLLTTDPQLWWYDPPVEENSP